MKLKDKSLALLLRSGVKQGSLSEAPISKLFCMFKCGILDSGLKTHQHWQELTDVRFLWLC